MKKQEFIANELCLSYRRNEKLSKVSFTAVNSSKRMERVLRQIWNMDEIEVRESFYALFLSNKLDVVGYYRIADGGIDHVMVDIKLIMSCSLLSNATRIVIAHNHPSGTLHPSSADKLLTKRISTACSILEIRLIDHIILTNETYYSFSDNGDL